MHNFSKVEERLIRLIRELAPVYERTLFSRFWKSKKAEAERALSRLISIGFIHRIGTGKRGHPFRIIFNAAFPADRCPLCYHSTPVYERGSIEIAEEKERLQEAKEAKPRRGWTVEDVADFLFDRPNQSATIRSLYRRIHAERHPEEWLALAEAVVNAKRADGSSRFIVTKGSIALNQTAVIS